MNRVTSSVCISLQLFFKQCVSYCTCVTRRVFWQSFSVWSGKGPDRTQTAWHYTACVFLHVSPQEVGVNGTEASSCLFTLHWIQLVPSEVSSMARPAVTNQSQLYKNMRQIPIKSLKLSYFPRKEIRSYMYKALRRGFENDIHDIQVFRRSMSLYTVVKCILKALCIMYVPCSGVITF